MNIKFDASCDGIRGICDNVVGISKEPQWQAEIARLPSGVPGFVFMALEDAVADFGCVRGKEVGGDLVISFRREEEC